MTPQVPRRRPPALRAARNRALILGVLPERLGRRNALPDFLDRCRGDRRRAVALVISDRRQANRGREERRDPPRT